MAKPILRVGKIKATGTSTPGSVMGHLARSRPTPNADAARTPQNRWLVGSATMDLGAEISRIHKAAAVEPRADAVLANDVLITVSPDWFRKDPSAHGTWSPGRLKTFEAEATQLLRKEFGKRVVAAVLHLDEATPHIQAVVVPIMKAPDGAKDRKWRLSSKDMFGPEQLSSLQQAWEDRMRPHGVGPRQIGSRARHVTLREYYGAIDSLDQLDPRKAIEISDPPAKGLLEGKEAFEQRTTVWKKAEAKRLREELRPLAVEAARGRLWEAERQSRSEVVGRLKTASRGLQAAREGLQEARKEAQLSKEQIADLRRAPINAVAAALEWHDPVPKGWNAIDLVKHAGGLDYVGALGWLAQRFGPETAATAARQSALRDASRLAESPPILTKGEKVKQRLVTEQLAALAAPAYRITVSRPKPNGDAFVTNLGKGVDGVGERLWTAKEVADMVPRLTAENLGGGHIYVTPIDDGTHHVLVDDLTADRLSELRDEGYTSAAVIESSKGSFQAVLKVSAQYPKEAVNEWFKDLNRARGDQKITGLRHPFRLAGFENRKPKHADPETGRFPFVRLAEATNVLCARAREVVHQYALQIAQVARQRALEDASAKARRAALSADAERRTLAPRQ